MKAMGIDPGKHGAIAILDGANHEVHDMPVVKLGGKDVIDLDELFRLLKTTQPEVVFVEKQQAFPKQGGVSNFSTGYGYGSILMALTALGVRFEEVSPQKWQKHFGVHKDTKGQSCAIAARMFPALVFRGPRGAALDGRADAVLIAEYGRRRMSGMDFLE